MRKSATKRAVTNIKRGNPRRLLKRHGDPTRAKNSERPKKCRSGALTGQRTNVEAKQLIKRLDALQQAICATEFLQQETKRMAIEECCIIASRLRSSPALWGAFIAAPQWQTGGAKPQRKHYREALRFVLRWVFGLTGEAAKTPNLYYRAVAPLLKEGVAPEQVAAEIKNRGGLKMLAAEHVRRKPPKAETEHHASSARDAKQTAKVSDQIKVSIQGTIRPQATQLLSLPINGEAIVRLRMGSVGGLLGMVFEEVLEVIPPAE